ncbi:protein IMPACT-A-like [Cotesia glomerata]|uniref:protein IMPACT-A-like n=1 Tax=Cotesia glomerata TaxID=32391 RepID=UPI001D02DF6A|nr:protein IMPACT-A-like [Cotesia glomerata]XP_044576142.1 protein IMPACT-A-like [Cotesia glomerata]
MDNFTQQVDEIEALTAIYGDDWQVEDEENRAFSMNVHEGDKSIKLYVKLTADYPSSSPPYFELSAPQLRLEQKNHINSLLQEVYLSLAGGPVLYEWIEKIREELQKDKSCKIEQVIEHNEVVKKSPKSSKKSNEEKEEKIPEIYHGDVIVDRKSSFQGHAAQVFSVHDVKNVLKKLYEIKKIEQATHNMYAYRIVTDNKNFAQDCEDDGESQAGSRLLHFLQIVDAKNVLVVISRWYGGIHLGPDRFRHINNAARQVLEAANLISRNKEHKK